MPLGRLGYYGVGTMGSLGAQSARNSYENQPPPIAEKGITQENGFYFETENNDYFVTEH
jgi:hypothetical protein